MKKIFLIILCLCYVNVLSAAIPKENPNSKPLTICVSFIKWYMRNRLQIHKYYPIDKNPGDSTRLYKINYKHLKKYLNYLGKSGYVTQHYLNMTRQNYIDIREQLLKDPQWDGPIPGHELIDPFEIDELDIDGLSNLKVKLIKEEFKGNYALIIYTINGLKFNSVLFKINHKWQINRL